MPHAINEGATIREIGKSLGGKKLTWQLVSHCGFVMFVWKRIEEFDHEDHHYRFSRVRLGLFGFQL